MYGGPVEGVGTPIGAMFSLAGDSGQTNWTAPVADGIHAPIVNDASSGIAIAEHKLFVAAGGAGYSSTTGYVVAYHAGS